MLGWPGAADLVLRQQCALLAALCGAAGGEGASELAGQALGLARGGSPALGLRLLTALAQEADSLDRTRRLALVAVLQPRSREVLGILGGLLAAAAEQLRQGGGGAEAVAVGALQCAEAWLELGPVAGGGCASTPGELQAAQAQLLGGALGLLGDAGAGSEAVLEAAVQLLLLVYGPENFSSDEAADAAATAALAHALLAARPALAGPHGDALAGGVAKLAAAAAERAPELVCGQLPEAPALAELVLEVLSRPGPEQAAAAIDFLLMANTLSLAERPPALRAPLYEAALQRAAAHATYPAGFTTWDEEAEVDEDAFRRLR